MKPVNEQFVNNVRVLSPEEHARNLADWAEAGHSWPEAENRNSAARALQRKTGQYAKLDAKWRSNFNPAAYGFPTNPKPVKIDSSKTMMGKETK